MENNRPFKPLDTFVAQAIALISQLSPTSQKKVYEGDIKPKLDAEGRLLVERYAMRKSTPAKAKRKSAGA